jgi:pyruvate,water dikinase
MVRSDKASSGVMFSLDTETGFKDVVLINAAWGLGENVVQGAVNPDEYLVFKPTLQKFNKRAIIRKNLGSKKLKMVYNSSGGTKNTKTAKEERDSFCLTDDEIIQLSRWAITIEEHYSARKGKLVPMDMEWAKDGISNELFIVQSRYGCRF